MIGWCGFGEKFRVRGRDGLFVERECFDVDVRELVEIVFSFDLSWDCWMFYLF